MSKMPLGEFADRLHAVMFPVMKGFLCREREFLDREKLTHVQFVVLFLLSHEGSLTMTKISSFMGVSMATTTGIVARLVNCGLVKRALAPADRRLVFIALTPKGLDIIGKMVKEKKKLYKEIFARISEKDRASYLKVFYAINDILQEHAKCCEKK
jgi:DNA-binding MarR family transcriptional regulator